MSCGVDLGCSVNARDRAESAVGRRAWRVGRWKIKEKRVCVWWWWCVCEPERHIACPARGAGRLNERNGVPDGPRR